MPENSEPASAPTPSFRPNVTTFDGSVSLDGAARAIVTAVWIWNRTTRESHAALLLVDLEPDEVPLLDVLPPWDERLGKHSAWTVYGDSRELTSSDALIWYDKLVHDGIWVPPWRPFSSPVPLSNTLNEPRWPNLVTLGESRGVPFATRRGGGCRLHHVLSEEPRLAQLLEADEHQRLVDALRDTLDVDLSKTPELWQSAHFFQPVPFIRYVSTRLDTSDADQEAVLLDVVPRKGFTLDNLTVDVLEQRPTGQRLLARLRPTRPFHRIPVGEQVDEICVRLYHDRLGLLLEEGPYSFIRSVHIGSRLVSRERRVPMPERKGRPAYVKRIPVSGAPEVSIVGSAPETSAAQVLRTIHYRSKAAGQSYRQMWFSGDEPAAEREVQKVLSKAERRALVIDPYFTALEVRRWLPDVAVRGAEVQVLTSSEGLRKRKIPGSASRYASREKEHLERLCQEVRDTIQAGIVNPTSVKVMGGKSAAIHDRFLVIDDRVWVLGSSLNSFGARGTIMIELPLPTAILPQLEAAWDQAHSLVDRLAKLGQGEEES